MARDQIEVDLLLNAKKAEATIKQMNRELSKMGKTMGQAFSGAGGGAGNKVRALGTGLSKATVRADEFSKSLEASNARVIAFGASAGLIMNVDRAMRAMVKTTIQVEKAMADVNVVMNVSSKQLDQFGKGMFKVAKDTAQGFSTVAEASTELARQGLGMEKTLARTKDALILTRLTGMNAADAVKSLTAAVNSFSKEGATSAQVVNRMAKVDAQFAVSSEDLANAISRVGASAQSAGVSMNELMAITTAVQQRTARGGAVIGNAFKTIFTRIQRSDVQQKLENLGVATRSMSGEMLSGIQVLQNLAKNFDSLSKAQQSSTAESVAGVFQVNILKSALADLSQQNSAYAGALRAANTATDEAYRKNEKLNQTLDSLVNKTMANLVQAGSALGGNIFGPAISNVLNTVNSTIEAFSEGGKFESFGEGIGKNLVKGIGKFIGGPGLIIATAVFGKLALSLGKFATTAFKDIMGINNAVKQRAALEEIVVNTLASEPALLQKVKMGTLSVLDVEKQILATIKQQQAERAALKGYGGALAGSMYQRGTRVGSSGRAFSRGMGRMGRASGFVPNFANPNVERAAAAAGGYTAGAIKTMNQPGAGTMMYNSAETVKQFPGMSQKAIMPPKNSPAGAGYKSAFGAAHGFDPYAAEGFIPNFAPRLSKDLLKAGVIRKSRAGSRLNKRYDIPASNIGVLLGFGASGMDQKKDFSANASSLSGLSKTPLGKILTKENAKINLKGVRVRSFLSGSSEDRAEKHFESTLNTNLKSGIGTLSKNIMSQLGIEGNPGRMGRLSKSLQGEVFEESMRMAMKAAVAIPGAAFDFEAGAKPSVAMSKIFGQPILRIDAKRRLSSAGAGEMPKKYFNDPVTRDMGMAAISSQMGGRKLKALGYVPNFSPLSSSIARERQAGIPASKIRVGSSPALRSSGNPSGLGVYNTIDEPRGLNQGISRSRSMGINPKTHGVPNFALGSLLGKGATLLKGTGKSLGGVGKGIGIMELFNLMGAYDNPAANILSSGAMGFLTGGPKFAFLMAGITAVSEGLDYMRSSSEKSSEALKKQNQAQDNLSEASQNIASELDKATGSMQKNALQIAKNQQAEVFRGQGLTDDFDVMKKLNAATNRRQFDTAVATGHQMVKVVEKVIKSDAFIKTLSSPVGDLITSPPGEREFGMRSGISDFYGITPSSIAKNLYGRTKGNFAQASMLSKGVMQQMSIAPLNSKMSSLDVAKNIANVVARQLNLPESAALDIQSKILSKAEAMAKDPILANQFPTNDLNERIRHSLTQMSAELGTSFKSADIELDNLREAFVEERLVIKENTQTNLDNIKSLLLLRRNFMDLGSTLKLNHDLEIQRIRQAKAVLDLDNKLEMAQKSSTRTVYETIEAQKTQATTTAEFNQTQANEAAEAKRKREIGLTSLSSQTNAVDNVLKLFSEAQVAGKGAISRTAAAKAAGRQVSFYSSNFSKTNAEGADFMLRGMLEKRASLTAIKSNEGATMSFSQAADLAALEAIIPKFVEIRNAEYREREIAAQKAKDDAILAQKTHDLKIQEYNNQFELNTKQRQLERVKRAGLMGQTLEEAKALAASGQLGARGVGSAYEASINAQIAAGGVRSVNFGGVMGQTFKNEMSYGGVDAFEDFRTGVKDVAGTMKSSFADAFQSISSGATTVQGALANMAQSILSSINQMSTQIFTNMMFSKMFGGGMAKGGYVPGYAAGGLVTGGSGYKDDVLTKMQGGEFVIKKSAVNRIGVGTLNAINGYANGGSTGPSMGTMGLVAGVSGAATGILGAAMQDRPDKPLPSRNYGMGRGSLGYLGGADPDGGQIDRASGGGTSANVSLSKGFVYYRRDPETGRLVSERARPTEGRFEVSSALSLMGRLDEGDPQTSRMFDKEQRIANYQNYIAGEKASRRAQIRAVKDQKKSRLIGAYMNAAMLIGGAKLFGGGAGTAGEDYGGVDPGGELTAGGGSFNSLDPGNELGGNANGGLAKVMGGEYVMSPQAVRTHGVDFMTELNRGNVPRYASGGLVGNQTGGVATGGSGSAMSGNMTNNVKINVNIDKSGKAEASATAGSQSGSESSREESEDVQNNADLGKALQSVVLDELIKQQRPGGLLHSQS